MMRTENTFSCCGSPEEIITDKEPQFASTKIQMFLAEVQIMNMVLLFNLLENGLGEVQGEG